MPIHDVGYRSWRGALVPSWLRWWTLGETGCQLVFRSSWVKRLVFFAWLPVLYWGAGFFAADRLITSYIERAADVSPLNERMFDEFGRPIAQMTAGEWLRNSGLSALPKLDVLVDSLERGDRTSARHAFWSWLLMTFFRYPQSTIVVFLLGFIVPPLIARDIRSKALLLYFSRPIGRREYMLGKLMIPAVYLVFVTVLPALVLYVWGLSLAPDLTALWDTWDLPLRVIAAGLVLIIPTALLGLMLSSFTSESRIASFAWFALWALGLAAWFAVVLSRSGQYARHVFDDPIVKNWESVSLFLSMGQVQSWIFGFESFAAIWPSFFSLLVVSLVSLVLLYRNISRTAHGT